MPDTPAKSPFPGMDPWIEKYAPGDFNLSFLVYASDALQPRLPDDLVSRIDVREMYVPEAADDLIRERCITIQRVRSRPGENVVTAIELLSEFRKKYPEFRNAYLQHRERWLRSGVNVVEIDLLRGGEYTCMVPYDLLPTEHVGDYRICVWRERDPERFELYFAGIRERLPVIAVPLRRDEPDLSLDIQALVDRCYERGRYDDFDYTTDPDPPLNPEDAHWADALLREEGLR